MKKISTAVDRIVTRIIGKKALKEYEVFREWNSVVGDVVAQVSVPVKVVKGVLHVSVKNGTWRQELSMQKMQILKKIEAKFGADIITDIRFQ
jgi:predicted nucleic acid-binding Zn ribbon protein